MPSLLMRKWMGGLRPVDDRAEEAFARIKNEALVKIEIKMERHLEHHRLFWVLMTLVWQQCDSVRWPTVEDFADSVKIMAGLRRNIFLPDGAVIYSPGSIAFRNMDQIVFAAFFERVCDVIAIHFLPGITKNTLYEEVGAIVGPAFMPRRIAA